ncbi:hypothetical protein GVO57_10455 [Sphingomonas changnyeongensis]|uniref:Uncharacterized protein n=1 Tax=Sphingomonas changnyeongensis TaxID=2698679 RepID=A0A7Z2NWM9_9SPHN|nr:hypothetical protein [Sphingomonas changnyeongensis]QHL91160.1 hypothetical protein GVO57_10455 [Sphingomonas changnyeongensis]
MIYLPPIIERIRALLDQDTDQGTTYAALEARLALEKVCYDRLRQRHDYISHADLRGWNPNYVINKLMAEVDQHVGQTMTLSIGRNPGVKPEDDDFMELGTQIGFNPSRISKLWNALAKLALHVRLPENRDDHIPDYGDKAQVREKVEETIVELERLAKGTMDFSGLGEEVSFECPCGQRNKRRAELLEIGQVISCFNPQCSRSFKVQVEEDGSHTFELDAAEIPCAACGAITMAPQRELHKMKPGEMRIVRCLKCGHENRIAWLLMRAELPSAEAAAEN